MANLFSVNDQVICQKKGGQTGTKATSPEFPGVVTEVLPGGTEYRVRMKGVGMAHVTKRHFPGDVVKEEHMTAA